MQRRGYRKYGAIPLLPLWAFIAHYRVNFIVIIVNGIVLQAKET
jgi:uncharacterized membrane protein (GlpM family)